MGNDEWTVVRRGRRGQGPRPKQGDRSGSWCGGAMESASFFPSRGRAQAQYPNPPVPPPRAARCFDPQPRSYAEVVRQVRPARRAIPPQRAGSEARRQPAEPQFGKLVRKCHLLIRMIHHLQNVANKPDTPEPRMISRMVNILSDMIKPAAPNKRTQDLLMGNAKNWGYNIHLILREHYETGIEEVLNELTNLLIPDWKSAFQVATRWARRNLPRLSQEVIEQAEAQVAARAETAALPQKKPLHTEAAAQVSSPHRATVSVDTADLLHPLPSLSSKATVSGRSPKRTASKAPGTIINNIKNQKTKFRESKPVEEPPREQREQRRRSRVALSECVSVRQLSDHEKETEMEEEPPQVPSVVYRGSFSVDSESSEDAPPDPNLVSVMTQVHRKPNIEEEIFEDSLDYFTVPEQERIRPNRHPDTQHESL